MNDVTVIYYSSNRESEYFERKIRRQLRAAMGDRPLISVTQQPAPELGHNICVGDVGASEHNCKRQIEIGCASAKTDWVIFAEADFLYPPEYFAFDPQDKRKDAVYFYQPIALLWNRRNSKFRFKHHSEGAMACSRELVLRESAIALAGRPLWNPHPARTAEEEIVIFPEDRVAYEYYSGTVSALSFKTDHAMHRRHQYGRTKFETIPGWGHYLNVRNEYFPKILQDLHYASHLPLLLRLVEATTGAILEMGMGAWSTPILHMMCLNTQRPLVSMDHHHEWHEENLKWQTAWHQIHYIDDWATAAIEQHWGLAFVDHAPGSRRRHDIARLAPHADIVVVHDTESPFYRYEEAFRQYRYRYDYTRLVPHTTALSNRLDVARLLAV